MRLPGANTMEKAEMADPVGWGGPVREVPVRVGNAAKASL